MIFGVLFSFTNLLTAIEALNGALLSRLILLILYDISIFLSLDKVSSMLFLILFDWFFPCKEGLSIVTLQDLLILISFDFTISMIRFPYSFPSFVLSNPIKFLFVMLSLVLFSSS